MAQYLLDQIKIENVLQNIITKSTGEHVTVNVDGDEKTLAAALAEILASVASLPTTGSVDTKISTAIDALIAGAPGTYDTLNEIALYIAANEDVVSGLNAAIGNKVDKESGKGLSANDFTSALKNKLDSLKKVEASSTNGNIKLDGVETTVYAHPAGEGSTHIPAGGTAGQVLTRTAAGYEFKDAPAGVRYGTTAPADMKDGELFVRIVS